MLKHLTIIAFSITRGVGYMRTTFFISQGVQGHHNFAVNLLMELGVHGLQLFGGMSVTLVSICVELSGIALSLLNVCSGLVVPRSTGRGIPKRSLLRG